MNIAIGDSIPPWTMASVSAERMRTMAAILRDPNPVHWDNRVVAELGFGDHAINQGPLGLSYMINMLHAWTGPESIRRLVMRFPMVVLDGDCVIAQGVVTDIRTDILTGNGERVADCDIWLARESSEQSSKQGTNTKVIERPLEGHASVVIPAAS